MSKMEGIWNISVNTGMSYDPGQLEIGQEAGSLSIYGGKAEISDLKLTEEKLEGNVLVSSPWGQVWVSLDLTADPAADQLSGWAYESTGSYPITGSRA